MRARLVPFLVVLLAAALSWPAAAYVIYLKAGDQITAREKPVIQGKFLIFYTPLGAMQKIPASEYDEKKTEKMNALGTGDAYVLGDSPQEKSPDGGPPKQGLSEYIKVNKKSEIGDERKPIQVAPETGKSRLQDVATGPTLDPQVESTLLHTLESFGLKGPRVSAATTGVRVQGVAETEDQVFGAIKGIAKAISDTKSGSKPISKAEIYLSTSSGESAGHFEMTSEDAEALVTGKRTTASWFMSNLIL